MLCFTYFCEAGITYFCDMDITYFCEAPIGGVEKMRHWFTFYLLKHTRNKNREFYCFLKHLSEKCVHERYVFDMFHLNFNK